MPILPEGKKLLYKGGLVTLPRFFAFYVGVNEVSAGNYRRVLVVERQWSIQGNILYLNQDLDIITPDENWGVVDGLKLVTLPEGVDMDGNKRLVEWVGGQFSLMFADGRAVGASGVVSGRGIFLKGGLDGLRIEIPD